MPFEPTWSGKKFEIQIKTLLEEAFDAKSHDLTYKQGNRLISSDLEAQFVNFSQVLKAVDLQSEFLKGLILAGEKKIALRRGACVYLYLKNKEDLEYGRHVGLDPESSEHAAGALARIQQLSKQDLSLKLCRLAATFALRYSDELLTVASLQMCSEIVDKWSGGTPGDANVYLSVATVEWALGSFDAAMGHVLKAVDHAQAADSVTSPDDAKSTFVYLYSDWSVMHPGEVREDWNEAAQKFADELAPSGSLSIQDTLGFQKIVFGKSSDEIEEGRRLVHAVHGKADPILRPFLHYHDHIALTRLLGMLPSGDA